MDFHYDYITTPDAFREAIDALRGAPIIGVDTEGDSLYSYQERVSLIQISGAERHFIFDPLLLETVEPLGALLEERSILKIFHGADYDLVSLKRDFGFNISATFTRTRPSPTTGSSRATTRVAISCSSRCCRSS